MGKRVVILGGGMAALSTAWRITSRPDWRSRFDTVEIYQMGWRLGGKCATGRGPMGRIEEHGIHLFGGGYYNTLPMMRAVYQALHGDVAAGDAAFKTAFEKQFTSVRVNPASGIKSVLRFPANTTDQGTAGGWAKAGELHRWLAAAVQGMRAYLVDADDTLTGAQAMLMQPAELLKLTTALVMATPAVAPAAGLAIVEQLIAALQAGQVAQAATLADQLSAASLGLWPAAADADLANVVGAVTTTLKEKAPHLLGLGLVMLQWSLTFDFIAAVVRAWLAVIAGTTTLPKLDLETHDACLTDFGARPATRQSDLVLAPIRILYQFRDGNSLQPSLAAGCFLHWLLRSFAYAEAPFWFFEAGTGETVIRPLFQVLQQRGVGFHFFHRVEAIEPADDASHIARVRFRVQATTTGGAPYAPLDNGCWPDRPLSHQLENGHELAALPADALECYWSDYRQGVQHTLNLTPDDAVVLAIPPAALPTIAPAVLAGSAKWQAMAASVASVETQSLQLWLDEDSHTLGVNQNASQAIQPDDTGLGAGFVAGFHTFADFSTLIRHEGWPAHNRPRALWYFSDVMPTAAGAPAIDNPHYPAQRQAEAILQAHAFVTGSFGRMLPGSPPPAPGTPPRFDPAHLVVPDPARAGLPIQRISQQFIRTNVQPSERYVQAMPGTIGARLRAGTPVDFSNLHPAGDWTCNGLNVGCVEATVMSGIMTANVLLGRTDTEDVRGHL